MRIKIKDIRGEFATGKHQLLDPDGKEKKNGRTNRERGYRPLEAGEVIELDDKQGEAFIDASRGVLEVTKDDPTRPLFFGEEGLARTTSARYNTDSPERQEAQEEAHNRVREMMNERTAE